MESKLVTDTDQVVITLTNDECLAIAAGESVIDRNNPFDPMAKVEVVPLQQLDPTYEPFDAKREPGGFFDALSRVACRAIVLGNNDIRVFVPDELVRYAVYSTETIALSHIQGDEEVVPQGGIKVEFSSRL